MKMQTLDLDSFDGSLRSRLLRLEAAAPSATAPQVMPLPTRARFAGRWSLAAATAVLGLVLVAGAAVGRFATQGEVQGWPGFENFGQPFWGTGIGCMKPPQAQRLIVDRGFTPYWQVEHAGSVKGDGSTPRFSSDPPAEGVIWGGFVRGTTAHVVVVVGGEARPGC
jgi:hypothetical protein